VLSGKSVNGCDLSSYDGAYIKRKQLENISSVCSIGGSQKIPTKEYRWVILILTYICMLGFAFVFQSLPPILTLVVEELKLSHAQAGLLMSLFALPAIFLSIPGGLLSDYYGIRKIGIISLVIMIVGTLLVALSDVFLNIGLGRLLSGVGAVTLSIVASQLLSQWFVGREIGTAMGIHNTAMPVGTIICLSTFGMLGENLGWRVPIFITTIISTMCLIVFLLLYRSASDGRSERKENGGKKGRGIFSSLWMTGSSIWLVGFSWMWFNAAVISFTTFAPDFFVSKGYGIGLAGFLTSLLMWGSLCLSPVVGRLIDWIGGRELLIGIGGATLSVAIYMVPSSTNFILPMIIMAIAVALVPAPIFSFPSKILKPTSLGLGFGIISTCMGIGVSFGPSLAGLVRDRTGSYQMSFILLSVFAILVTLTAAILRLKSSRIS